MNKHFPYGYVADEQGQPVLDSDKAPYVTAIFEKYLNGASQMDIMKWLNEVEAPAPKANSKWGHSSIGYVLKNIKYTGAGEFPAIITKEILLEVEEKRKKSSVRYDNKYYTSQSGKRKKYPFTGKLVCAKCNRQFTSHKIGRKKYGQVHVWRCGNYIVNNTIECELAVTNSDLEQLFVEAFKEFCKKYKTLERRPVSSEKPSVNEEVVKIDLEIKEHLKENNPNGVIVLELLKKRTNELWNSISLDEFEETTEQLRSTIITLEKVPDYFDEELFNRTIKEVTLYPTGKVAFIFLNGISIQRYYEDYSKRGKGK